MNAQMAKKLMQRREKMAFGSLKAEANGTTHSTQTDASKPDVDAGTTPEGEAQNATESFQNSIVPIVPIPRLVGHHIAQEEKVQIVRDANRNT